MGKPSPDREWLLPEFSFFPLVPTRFKPYLLCRSETAAVTGVNPEWQGRDNAIL